jgi:hypothetical protein
VVAHYLADISAVATMVARPSVCPDMRKPRYAGVPSLGTPMSSTSRACTVMANR